MRTNPRSMIRVVSVLAVASLLSAGCGSGSAGDDGGPSGEAGTASVQGVEVPKLRLVPVGRFAKPVHALAVPDTDLIAVVEQGGRVHVVADMACAAADNCPDQLVTSGREILDISDEVSTGSEQGLLGLAFHPRWPDDPRLYINYTDRAGDTRIEAWTLDAPGEEAVRDRELLRIEQPYENHNGGHLAFGPDGLLYIGTGDGGSAGDPEDRAQQPDTSLGKLLRIDVDRGGERGFAIPAGNVRDGAPEVWAVGLRNPWRFSFDSKTGDLWIGDVGQDTREEVNSLSRAQLGDGTTRNFEWRRREGFRAFDRSGIVGPGKPTPPVLDYGRKDGCSVTGGVVYRGRITPKLRGWYVFGDFCGEDLRLLPASGVPGARGTRGRLEWVSVPGMQSIASFAEIQRGELLVVSLGGTISQVVPA